MLWMVAGLVVKGAVLLIWHLFRRRAVLTLLIGYDPLGIWSAESLLPLSFDMRGIAPPAGAASVFEVLLLMGFGLQTFTLGLIAASFEASVGRLKMRRPFFNARLS